MNVSKYPIYQFLEGSRKCFMIPVYQRDYAWNRINCQKLWQDLIDLNNNTRLDKNHFLGTIVTVNNGFDEHIIIDGQQRLITISILLIALRNFLQNNNLINNLLVSEIEDLLINKHSDDDAKRIRLKPNKQDKDYFEELFKNEIHNNIESNIVSNYNFFYDQIKGGELTPNQLFEAFRKLLIVLIDLTNGQDNPQLIFESLNSTGVKLTSGDLIRNYILMDLDYKQQENLYKNYWLKIESLTNNDVAEFIRNYLIFKVKSSIKKEDVYDIFKKFSSDTFNRDQYAILQDLLYFAGIYGNLILSQNHYDKNINSQLQRLNKLEFTVAYPYLFDVFNDLNQKTISENDVKSILIFIESYAFRKILVDNSTQGLNKMFVTLSKEIKKEELWKEKYLELFKFILLAKKVSQRIPTDEEFEETLLNKDIYSLQAKNKNLLLGSLENYNSAYFVDIEDPRISIEHIMPRQLDNDWKTRLGSNWQEIQIKYLNTLGNLTLTSKNSALSNNSFEIKQKIDYQTSKLKLNSELNNLDIWDENKIIERARSLIKEAKEIWPYPKTTYIKKISDEQLFDLSSEDNFSGMKPHYLYLDNSEKGIELKNWRDLLILVCKYLYGYSPTEFKELEISGEFKKYFNKEQLRTAIEFSKDKFVEGHFNTTNILSLLQKLCNHMDYPTEKIQFSIRNTLEQD